MNRPNPSHTRAALFGTAALIIAALFCAAPAATQSGRKAQKPLGLPTEKPKDDPAAKPTEKKPQEALYTFVVVKADTLSVNYDTLVQDGVNRAFVERLHQVGRDIEVRDGGKGRRQEARERAKKEEKAFVVYFQLDEQSMATTSVNMRGLVIRTYVYTPKTADLKFSDTIWQRPYQDTATIGGVRVPVPTRRVERYPSQYELEQAARDAADRLLARFSVTPPPEQ